MKPTHCKYCGARLKRDVVGLYCPTHNCQWAFGIPDEDETKTIPVPDAKIYQPTKFLICYWTPQGIVVSTVDINSFEQQKPFFAQDPRCATAAIEAKLQEMKEEKI